MDFFKAIFKSLFNISRPVFHFDNNELNFKISSDFSYSYPLSEFDVKTRHDPYVLEAYSIKTKDIFLESIKFDEDTKWLDEPIRIYERFMQTRLSLKSLKRVYRKKLDSYSFHVYETNTNSVFFFIHIDDNDKDIFITDYRGDIFKKLLSSFSFDENSFDEKPKLHINFDISLVKSNGSNNFFSQD